MIYPASPFSGSLETYERLECGLAAAVAESLGLSENCVEFLRLCRPEAEPQTLGPRSGKPEAFLNDSG